MPLRLMPDAEQVTRTFLAADTDVATAVADRIYTVLPATKVWPLVRLTRVGGPTDATPDDDAALRDRALIQVEVYGGPKAQAWAIASTVRAVLLERMKGLHSAAWVERVTLGDTRYLPDESFDPARPRVLFDATVYLRPAGDHPNP